MAIDLGHNPVGTPPSEPQKAQMRTALGVPPALHLLGSAGIAVDATDPENVVVHVAPSAVAAWYPTAREVEGAPVAGSVALDLSESRWQRVIANDDIELDVSGAERGEFYIILTFAEAELKTVTLPANWKRLADSEDFDIGGKVYIIKDLLAGGSVYYTIRGHFEIDEETLTSKAVFIGDHGQDTDPTHDTVGDFVNGLFGAHTIQGLLLGGDNGYEAGSVSDINSALVIFEDLLAEEKIFPVHGNHDLDTTAINFTSDAELMALASFGWRYNSSSGTFASDWKTNTDRSDSWEQTGAANKVPGFGETDSTGQPINDGGATYYFARSLWLESAPAAGKVLRIQMYIDDGARVFINGTQIYDFVLIYPVSDASLARPAIGAGATETVTDGYVFAERRLHTILVRADLLQAGDNLFCAEVHQASTSSSDLSWDMGIHVGTSTDVVPASDGLIKYTNGYGQPMINKFPYIPNACKVYRQSLGDHMDLIVFNDGYKSLNRQTNPEDNQSNSYMAQLVTDLINTSEKPWKLVMTHRPFFSIAGSDDRVNTALHWSAFNRPDIVILNGHNHQTYLVEHTSGMHIVNASNVGRTNALQAPAGSTSGMTVLFADATNATPGVAFLEASAHYLRIRLYNAANGSLFYEKIIPAPVTP